MLSKQDICPKCGTIDEEWRDPETKRLLEIPPYKAELHACAGCEEMEETWKEAEQNEVPKAGLSLRMTRTDPLDYVDGE